MAKKDKKRVPHSTDLIPAGQGPGYLNGRSGAFQAAIDQVKASTPDTAVSDMKRSS